MEQLLHTILETITAFTVSFLVFLGLSLPTHNLVYTAEEVGMTPQTEKVPTTTPQEETPTLDTLVEELPETIHTKEEVIQVTETPQIEAPEKEVAIPERETLSPSLVNEKAREALVNIYCLPQNSGFFNPITASGVLIDSRGVIVTNAHVAQYFLLETYEERPFINCVIRTGSPARPLYTAKLLYLSPTWIEKNAQVLVKSDLPVTGEADFAFLLITGTTNASRALPEEFPHLPIFPLELPINRNDPVLAAGYPAGFLGGITITKDLWVSTSLTTIRELFTLSDRNGGPLDVISVGGIIGAQEGASGGAVVSLYDTHLLGVITLRTGGDTTAERDLRAITLKYIDRKLHEEAGYGIQSLLTGDLNTKVELFATTTLPTLKQKLLDVLEN